MGRHILTSRLVRETRDFLVRAGAGSRQIDRFVSEVADASPAVARSICETWREKYNGQGSGARVSAQEDNLTPPSPVKLNAKPGRKRQVKRANEKELPPNPEPEIESPLLCRAETPAECARCPVSRFFACIMGEEAG